MIPSKLVSKHEVSVCLSNNLLIMSPENKSIVRASALVAVGVVLVGGSFLFASSDFTYSAKALLAAASNAFSTNPSITISRSPNSPSGYINPGRMQALAVFDVKARYTKQVAFIRSLSVVIFVSDPAKKLGLSRYVLDYHYCLSKGDVYGYGYSYDDSGLFCRNITAPASSISTENSGNTLNLVFSGQLPVYPNQVSSEITVSAFPQYRAPDQTGHEIAEVQANVNGGAGFMVSQMSQNASAINPEVNVYLATGVVLYVSPHYGYGYAYIDSIYPNYVPLGSNVDVRGWNLSKTGYQEGRLWIESQSTGGSAIIIGNKNSNDNNIQFTLANRYCLGEQCESYLSITPGPYRIFTFTPRGRSNSYGFAVTPSFPIPPQPPPEPTPSLTCDATAQSVIKSVGGCEVIDHKKYQNVYIACCRVTKEMLLTILDNALADGVIDEHEKSLLLTALNSRLSEL